jgi:addiction module HigA family antidote
MKRLEAKKALLSCPGNSIQETIDDIGMSQAELAERLGRSIPKLNKLIKGKAPIKKDTATKLEYILDAPANFWLNLERQYQDELLEIERMEFLEKCIEWIKPFPILLMKKMGVLPNTNDKPALAYNLLKFFRVPSPEKWSDIYKGSSLAFKIELRHTAEPEAISVWLRLGEIQAEKISTSSFDKKKIKKRMGDIQELSYEFPEDWLEKLQQICADCGIALVYTPRISKAPIYGATRWIKNNSLPLIQITARRKDYNAFWFTFYHELAHILYHGKKDTFIEGLEGIQPDQEKEDQADAFAARMLLSKKERNEITQYFSFDKETILTFSTKYRKHPGIVVAQLQRADLVKFTDVQLMRLKERVAFKELRL